MSVRCPHVVRPAIGEVVVAEPERADGITQAAEVDDAGATFCAVTIVIRPGSRERETGWKLTFGSSGSSRKCRYKEVCQ